VLAGILAIAGVIVSAALFLQRPTETALVFGYSTRNQLCRHYFD
jgi:hypothetical protein